MKITHPTTNASRAALPTDRTPLYTTNASQPKALSPLQRRQLLLAIIAAPAALSLSPARAAVESLPPPPKIGDCTDCIGVVNDTLNTCDLNTPSCVSTLNDDEAHFVAPWEYDGPPSAAVSRLVDIATGGAYDPGLIGDFGGISKVDAAGYIVSAVGRVVTNTPGMPEQPKRRRKTDFIPFDGKVEERKTTEEGGQYVRIVFGGESGTAPEDVVDAEFLFYQNDSIVNIRASSRSQPPTSGLSNGGQLALSFTNGLVVDRNIARRKMEALRTALQWQIAPVVVDFDPKFNAEAPMIVEKVFKPFDDRNKFQPSGMPYPGVSK